MFHCLTSSSGGPLARISAFDNCTDNANSTADTTAPITVKPDIIGRWISAANVSIDFLYYYAMRLLRSMAHINVDEMVLRLPIDEWNRENCAQQLNCEWRNALAEHVVTHQGRTCNYTIKVGVWERDERHDFLASFFTLSIDDGLTELHRIQWDVNFTFLNRFRFIDGASTRPTECLTMCLMTVWIALNSEHSTQLNTHKDWKEFSTMNAEWLAPARS